MEIKERLAALRAAMKKEKIDYYVIPSSDDHQSEYPADHFKTRAYCSGFSGSAGTLVVGMKEAGLWTDGRYFVQAAKQLKNTGITLYKMGQAKVPTIEAFLTNQCPKGGTVGMDGQVVSSAFVRHLENQLKPKKAKVVIQKDLVNSIWNDRPGLPTTACFELARKYTGETTMSKLTRIRKAMKEQKADVLILTALEDIAWTTNLRANDVSCTPVFYSYLIIEAKKAVLFTASSRITASIKKSLSANKISVQPYEAFGEMLHRYTHQTLWIDSTKLNAYHAKMISSTNTLVDSPSPTLLYRGKKNKVEIANMKEANIKDGASVAKMMYWVKTQVGKQAITEWDVAEHLYALRAQNKNYVEPSFGTIAAFGPNAAMMHYAPSSTGSATLEVGGFLLVDSGGHYLEGTTDTTRTIACGTVSKEMKHHFTTVLRCMIRLATARFLKGCCGSNLDILARGPVWDEDLDFQCGTGHGVGYCMSVHEGPQRFHWHTVPHEAVLEEGMVITDEPGIYLPGQLGIRTENDLVCREGKTNEYGTYMYFDCMTLCPIDLDAILVEELNAKEIEWLNTYHAEVYKKLAPYMNAEEKTWLKIATRKIG